MRLLKYSSRHIKEGNILEENKKRYYVIDIIRAIAIINMVLFHFFFDLYAFGMIDWFISKPVMIWERFICCTFIFISGFCFSLGRKHVKRALTVLAFAGVMSAVTFIVDIFVPDTFISFGILCFIGSAMLITIPLNLLLKNGKVIHWLGFFASITLFIVFYNVNYGTILLDKVEMPQWLYSNYLTAYLGFPPMGFFTADYFSIFPWIFLFLSGYFAFGILKQLNALTVFTVARCKPLEFIGRHSLIIYVVHQVALFPLALIFSIIYQSILS